MKTNVNTMPATGYLVRKRDGRTVPYNRSFIREAILNCLLDIEGLKEKGRTTTSEFSNRLHEEADKVTELVQTSLFRHGNTGSIFIEFIQDQVELAFMRLGNQKAARSYVLYREERSNERKVLGEGKLKPVEASEIKIILDDGTHQVLNVSSIKKLIDEAIEGIASVDRAVLEETMMKELYDGIKHEDYQDVLVMSARSLIENDPGYSQVAARILLGNKIQPVALSAVGLTPVESISEMWQIYQKYFKAYIDTAVKAELMDPELAKYDIKRLAEALKPERDITFTYMGIQTLFDRYLLHVEDERFELPQAFFMRVAMGLAINEEDREGRAIEFYELLSSFDFMCSTPTLFNSGTLRPQLSSCYMTTVPDDLYGIFGAVRDNAMLSKFAGGLGNDWTPVRGSGSRIIGTNGKSQGVIPFLKVANDTAVAVNQGGKRKGAVCAYLETWHIDIREFLELQKQTGDDRRRTHDMNTANWIPDLFMKRVADEGEWTLFSPDEVPDLHDLVGADFEKAYMAYEKKAKNGQIKVHKTIKAVDLWRVMIENLYETGHPWITFKDPCNIRYTNQHVGVVHSSNVCTEITLHTAQAEIAVCNLGSVNVPAHMLNGKLDLVKLEKTIATAVRMLDNVIDYNWYNVPQARSSNEKHRPVGLGMMGFQDALYLQGIPYSSEDALVFADESMEAISFYTIKASSNLAEERGTYPTYEGSLWSRGILPIDSIKLLEKTRGKYLKMDQSRTFNWDSLREIVLKQGMRNSNVLAIAPTATISNICGVSQSVEPMYQNLFVKSNLSGEFAVVNKYLVEELKRHELWDEVMVNDLKYYDGSVRPIDRIPEDLKQIFATAFEVDSRWLIEAASRRQKWLDQAQSLNLYTSEASGSLLDNLYKLAWVRGLKTTYYLRSMGASGVAKTTVSSQEHQLPDIENSPSQVCSIFDPGCESCQ